jgi:predicted pyridoxine 5'-phosphate oxidase superfamily flavin-nucleotide-binding protein
MGYHEGELEVQRRAGVALGAARIARSIHATIPPIARRFVADRSFAILGAADEDGRVWASLLRGAPGFLAVHSDDRLRIAARLRVGDPLSAALAGDAEVGLLLIDPAARRRMRVNGQAHSLGPLGFEVATREVYANCPKYIRPREVALGVPEEAGAARPRWYDRLTPEQVGRLAASDTIFVASHHPVAGADVSHRGGAQGFVYVPAPDRIVIPDYGGNMMFNTLGNLASDPRAGVLLVDFDSGGTLQVTGRARIEWDPVAVAAFEGAERLVEIGVERVVETPGGRAAVIRP